MVSQPMRRNDDRIIIHFDYDCFYASVFEVENPALKGLPLCVQQKQIIVTCNYEARRRGLHKLQLIRDAKRICPDAVIVLGEDLTKFRDASKALYGFLRTFSWNGRVETLGFDEVFLDVTDLVDYNLALLNHARLSDSFFCLQRDDPTRGFAFDASSLAGHAYAPKRDVSQSSGDQDHSLLMRLTLGSHLAFHMRKQLEQHMGYTSTVGISTSKLLAKLVGNVNKPNGQTTLLPPYVSHDSNGSSNVTSFMDAHNIGKVPDIGFKMSRKLREYVLKRMTALQTDSTDTAQSAMVTVGDVRRLPGIDARVLDDVLAGPGMQRDVGFRTWCLLHGVDNAEVAEAKDTPKQISIEDSYLRMDTSKGVFQELLALSASLIRRMRSDLTEQDTHKPDTGHPDVSSRRWLVHPKTIRLSTRPRPPPGPDGTRGRASARISRSTNLPLFVFSLVEPVELLAERLVHGPLIALFRQLHPEKQGWDLSLINIAVTNMVESAGTSKASAGRDISKMFKANEATVQPWMSTNDIALDSDAAENDNNNSSNDDAEDPVLVVEDSNVGEDGKMIIDDTLPSNTTVQGSEDNLFSSQNATRTMEISGAWDDSDDDDHAAGSTCPLCGAIMPDFAITAHLRFHESND